MLRGDWEDSGYVFTNEFGIRLELDFISRKFRTDVERAGVPRIKLHALRHTFATIALTAGENPKVVSEVLVHSDIQTTLGLYSQHLPETHAATVRAVESNLFGATESSDRD